MRTLFVLILAMTTIHAQQNIPKSIRKEALLALSHYPLLEQTDITFKFKKKLHKSIMKAQPKFGALFKSRRKRGYVILISESFQLGDSLFRTKNLDSDILIGWLGHELGHIMDYRNRSNLNLIGFGINYYFSKQFIKEAERAADGYAVAAGLAPYILKAKNFILNKAGISKKYRNRIKELYLSPDEIMVLVKQLEETKETE
ncbi:hypothetical protein FK220_016890 [Flavobacteriaceae bacterium TP-CH-4]|uniref:Uncharacterized protein n=1 Tax=Pelagihabitans pacificus TaxID=2696054 RepID=A0A967B2W1_9FLAO|nr:hypothetical protein [Pelagihabitans pacificus]NHF61031.1 hypothetical protein [Pelagihabitans pacificus]